MISTVLYKTRCPECAKKGHDKSGDNLAIYSDGHSYCYSCGFYTTAGINKLKPRLTKPQQELPEDLDHTIIGEPLQWLKKYYSIHDIPWNILWSPSTSKLYFLIIVDGIVVGHQYRYFGTNPKHPKWISTSINEELFYIQGSPSTSIVLVEDIISAHKVSKVQRCLCLFGSNISLKRLATLQLLGYTNIIIWLDPDKQQESIKFQALATSLGLTCKVIYTQYDPKDYTIELIEGILNE